jgi:hypothetical protein
MGEEGRRGGAEIAQELAYSGLRRRPSRPYKKPGKSQGLQEGIACRLGKLRPRENRRTRRYDELIAAGGDAPLREFWKLGKRLLQVSPGEGPRPDRAVAR